MFLPQKVNVLLLIAILKMTGPAQGHQVFDLVFSFPATHTTTINMMMGIRLHSGVTRGLNVGNAWGVREGHTGITPG